MNLAGTRIALVFALAGLSACATVPTSDVTIKPVTATVSNLSGKTVSSINYQPCDETGSWLPLGVGPIASGNSATFDIPAPCVNLQAFYSDGRLAGSQSGVRRDFPFSWVIR